jgi:cytochrome c oxidase assembly protein subunit 15
LSSLQSIFTPKFFRRTGIIACSSVFLLFVLGGLVRVTGSGMGCPDWPKCFGLWAPPTCDCQLPPDYMQLFLEKRTRKVNRFVATLERIGWNEKANEIRSNKAIYLPEKFNATKAWIEYINRLFGVLAGFFFLVFWLFSCRYFKSQKVVFVYATIGFIALLLNAWLGSIVVATNLLPGIVSTHFMLSFLSILFTLIAIHRHRPFVLQTHEQKNNPHWNTMLLLSFLIVFLGTLAREQVESLALSGKLEQEGILNWSAMGMSFAAHRYLPLVFLIYTVWVWVRRRGEWPVQARATAWMGLLILTQIVLGAININWVLPPVTQVLHIVLGASLPILIFYWRIIKPIGLE